MAKEETDAAAAEADARNRAAQQQRYQVARARQRKRTRLRLVIVVGGIALGAGIAGGATFYAPGLFGLSPSPAPAAVVPSPSASVQAAKPQGPQPLTGPAQAIDGATLTVAGQTIRLQGVQAPPVSLVCKTNVTEIQCGDIARRVLASFAAGAPVACVPAPGAAQAGTVAVCRNQRGWDLAAMQVEAGWAIVQGTLDTSPYRAEQSRAKANGAGLWPGFVKPEQWAQASR